MGCSDLIERKRFRFRYIISGGTQALCRSFTIAWRKGNQPVNSLLNQTRWSDTKTLMRCNRSSFAQHFYGKPYMSLLSPNAFARLASAAAVVATAILFSVSACVAQSSPFAGFDGSWAGNGTVSLSDGSHENLRCRATYKVDGSGQTLQQTLRCASDSYKFDLSSNVTSAGDRISGNWSEASRGLNGQLQGTAGGGKIDVFVEASGFAATLTLTTRGNKQSVQISSKGDIRGVNITMTKT